MKKIIIIISIFLFSGLPLFADTELGIILGKPTGFSFNYYISNQNSINANIGWKPKSVNLSTDFLFNKPLTTLYSDKGSLPLSWAFGLGLQMNFSDDEVEPGIRIPLGIGFRLKSAPLSFKIELAPTMDMGNSTSIDLNGGLCIRYYF